jgi:hypothetical protein
LVRQTIAATLSPSANYINANAEVIDLAKVKCSKRATTQKGRFAAAPFIKLNGAKDGARTRDLRRDRAAL